MVVNSDKHPSFLVYGPMGSGLTTALRAFQEFHFLTMFGLPLDSVDRFLMTADTEGRSMAIVPELDPSEVTPTEVKTSLEALKKLYPDLKLLYLSAPTELLVQRFSAAEKRHPSERNGLKDAIEHEQHFYKAIKPLSDYHIDTSSTTDKELVLKVAKILNIDIGTQQMLVRLTSFGYKNGVPTDAELIFDMRFLPNPFYNEDLRDKTGFDKPVKDYILSFPETHEFLKHWQNLLTHSIPLYQNQGKTRITIGIGCTGGQHRSVAMTLILSEFLREAFPSYEISVTHREQNQWPQQTPTKIGNLLL